MEVYLDLLKLVLKEGVWHDNRTGVRSKSFPGLSMRFDLADGFPVVTTKKMAFNSAIGELIGFLRGLNSANKFRELGCRVWDANANENMAWLANPYRLGHDDLGRIYGEQWRGWNAFKKIAKNHDDCQVAAEKAGYRRIAENSKELIYFKKIDQLFICLQKLIFSPFDRRILFHAWNPSEIDEMALPPCHLLYQFHPSVSNGELSMSLYVRSNDLGLGTPFNLCEGAALLHLMARLSGYRARWFAYFIGDAHIYENHLEMIHKQLSRTPYPLPNLVLSDRIPDYCKTKKFAPEWLQNVEVSDFSLENYNHHAAITAPMAI